MSTEIFLVLSFLVAVQALQCTTDPTIANPCDASRPFLCKEECKCTSLMELCNDISECSGGFDEKKDLCVARGRHGFQLLNGFVKANKAWLKTLFFDASRYRKKKIVRALSVSTCLGEIQTELNMSDNGTQNLRTAFEAAGGAYAPDIPIITGTAGRWEDLEYHLISIKNHKFTINCSASEE